jgi:signal transduction histidine kinase
MSAMSLRADKSAPDSRSADSAFDAGEPDLRPDLAASGLGWRRRALVLVALLGCMGVFALARWLAHTPQIDARWAADAQGRLVLQDSPLPALRAHQGQVVLALAAKGEPGHAVDALLLHHSPRWQVDDLARTRQVSQQQAVALALATGQVDLHLDDGSVVGVPTAAQGYARIGLWFWPLTGVALLLVLFAGVVVLARPQLRNALYMVMALCQSANLLCMALETAPGLALPAAAIGLSLGLRLALDVATVAAVVHSCTLHPRRILQGRPIAAAAWLAGALGVALLVAVQPAHTWWWSQLLCLGLGAAALGVIQRSNRQEPNPYALVLRRLCTIALATLLLVTAAVALATHMPTLAPGMATGAALAWYLFLASLLLLAPFLARNKQVLREFALVAGISTVATSVDLLFVSVFAVGPFTSLAVAVFVGLAIYAGARQAILHRMLGSSMLTTERTFEHLYRAARDLQAQPQNFVPLLGRLLRELFEPLETQTLAHVPSSSRVVGGGSVLVVPVRGVDNTAPAIALELRFAQRGQRLFTHDDARLADRVVEQLRRAVAYDQAVERGRHEERLRIAQDLHDDIGARLLTLMYQAPTPEMEDYIRHTLQDLKTLTRGLAAAEHHLSFAAGEWKADLSQRLGAARARLDWACSYAHDMPLSVVQWSALTRVLRELVSNALYHGHASCVAVSLRFETSGLTLTVADDGEGRNPQSWAHGLGLGGVRKRVKLLGGEAAWRENQPRGIVCEAHMPDFATRI